MNVCLYLNWYLVDPLREVIEPNCNLDIAYLYSLCLQSFAKILAQIILTAFVSQNI